jgi:parvulin-like peptidyl-prolyl isomerase
LAATVNGEYIFLADYEEQLYQFQQSLVHTGVDLEGEEGRFHMEQARWDILNQMIDSVLIAQNAEGLGLAVTDDELALQVAADIEAGGGLDAFEDWLASAGWTKDDYQQVVLQSMLTNRAWAAITADVPASAEQVRARHIVLGSEEAAKQVWERLQQGADFESLAREESIDTSTSESGGDLGWFPRGVMAVELEEAAFALKAGEIGEPIRLSDQFHIVQVIERAEDRPLEEVLLLHLQQQRFDAWLEGLRESAVIERFISE